MLGLSISSVSGSIGYPVLFALVLGESAGLPIPGESSIMVAAVAASQGSLSLPIVLGIGIAAAILGDNLGYLGGRAFGRRVWTAGRIGKQRRETWLSETDCFFVDHGRIAVVAARWLPVARFTVAWLAGINRMPWRRFVLYNAIGGISWVLTIGLAAYAIGQTAQDAISALGLVGLAGLLVAATGHVLWRRHTGRRRGAPGGSSAGRPATSD
jgi:undecaprenyl-diphosphatase